MAVVRNAWLLSIMALSGFAGPGQVEEIIALPREPHHHLALHNSYVNVYDVTVAPHDIVALHRHQVDAVSVMLDAAEVTVRSPGKSDVHAKLAAGQIRLQPHGYVHSTTIDSDRAYRNVTVELLRPQSGTKNRCAEVVSAQPQDCGTQPLSSSNAGYRMQPQLDTDQTRVVLYRVKPRGTVPLAALGEPGLVVVLSPGLRRSGAGGPTLNPGSFLWIEKPDAADTITSSTEGEALFVCFVFKRE